MRLCLLSTCFMKPICQNMHENEVVPDLAKCLQHTLGMYKVSHDTPATGPSGHPVLGGHRVCPTSCLETEEGLVKMKAGCLLFEPVPKDNEVHPAA